MGIDEHMCNSILIKPNQIGTFLETLETIILAKKNSNKNDKDNGNDYDCNHGDICLIQSIRSI